MNKATWIIFINQSCYFKSSEIYANMHNEGKMDFQIKNHTIYIKATSCDILNSFLRLLLSTFI